jgi:hypothetical protein
MDYLKDLEIDEDNLHEIVDKQAVVSMQYHKLYVDKLDELNEQKRKVEIIKAELKEVHSQVYLIQSEIKTKEGKNPTAPILEARVLIDPLYKAKQQIQFDGIKKLNDIDKSVNILEGVVKNMQQRKNMIETKVSLFNMGINSTIRQNKVDKTKNSMLDKLNKKGGSEE